MEEEKINHYGFFFGWSIGGRAPQKVPYFKEDIIMKAWEQIDATCIFRYSKASILLDTLESELSTE